MPSVTQSLLSRECGGLFGLRLSGALAYSASCTSSTIINASGPEPSPPITAQFAQDPSSGKLLAIADQEGFVTILQTDRILPYSVRLDPGGQRPRAAWEAHKNLVHDLCWAKADSRLYTASGDSTVAVWDTSCATRLATGVEHQLSVKCLTAFGPGGDVFASGSRDGSILVWDVRLPGRRARMADGSSASTLACVWKAEGAHKVGGATPSRGNAGRGRTPVRSASQQQGVTSVVWLPHTSFLLASAGERCSLVKYWDLRCTASCPVDGLCTAASTGSGQLAAPGSLGLERSGSLGRASSGETPSGSSGHPGTKRTRGGTPRSQGSQPAGLQDLLFSFLGCRGTGAGDGGAGGTPATGAVSQGILSLSVTPQGDRLLVHCASGPHLLFSARAPQSGALATFHYPPSAHPANNRHKWFIRTAFSPDGTAFVAGAADSAAYVWQVDCPQRPPLALGGHDGCVGPVAWCPSDPCQLATGCDSGSLRLWRLSPELASPLDLDADLQGGSSGGGSQLLPDPDQGCPDPGGKGGGAAAAGTSAAGGQGAGLQPEPPADFDFDADFDDKENQQPERPLAPFPLTTQFNRAGAGAGGTPSASPSPRPSPRARQTPGRTQPSSSPSPSALPAGAVSSGGSRGPAVSDSSWVSPSPALGYPQQQPRSGGAVSGVSSRSPSPTQGRAAAHMAALGNGWVPSPAGAAGSSGVNGALLSGPAAGASTAAINSPLSPTTQTGPASVLPAPSALTLAVPPPALPPAAHPSRAARQVLGQVPGPPLAPSPGGLGSTSLASLAAALLPPAPELHSPRYRPGTLATAPQLLSSLMSSPRPQALAAGGGGLASLMPCSPRYVDAPRRNSLPGPSFLSSPRPAGPLSAAAAGGAPLAGQLSLPSPRSSWTAHAWGSSSRAHLGAHLGGLGSPLLSGVHLSPRPAGMPRLLPPPFPSPSPLGSLAAAAAGGGVGRAADLLTGTTARVQTALGPAADPPPPAAAAADDDDPPPAAAAAARVQTALAPAGEKPGGTGLPTGAAAELWQAAAAQGGEEEGEAGVSRQGVGPGMPGCSLPTTAAASARSTQQPATGPTPALGPGTGSHTGGTTTTPLLPPAALDPSKSRLPCAAGGVAPAQATAAAAAAASAAAPSQSATSGPATPLAPASLPAPGAVPSLPDLVLPAGLPAEFGAGSSAALLSLQSQSLFSPRYLAPAAVAGAPGQGLLPTLSDRPKCWGSKGRSRHPAPSQQQQQQGQQEGEGHGQQQGGKEEGQQQGQAQQRGQQQEHQDQVLGIQYAVAAIAAPGSSDSKPPSHSDEPAGAGHSLEAPGAPGAVSVAGGPAAAATGSDESGHTAPNTSGAGRQWAAAAAAEGGLGLGSGSSQKAAPAAASIQSETNHTEAVTATMHAAAVEAVKQVVSKLPGSDMQTAAELGSEQQAVGLRRQQQQSSSSSSQGSEQRTSRKRARPTSILQYMHTHSHAPLLAGGRAAGAGGGAGVQGNAGAWAVG
ncbi:hypothetical protein V8C86DRAFT_3024141, partial [Haematococcus lacustris]